MIKKKILIATGGTGGHIFPAYSVANYFLKKNYNVEVTTDKRGFKYLKDYKKLKLIKISSSPLNKKNPINLLISFFLIIFAICKSLLVLFLNRPSIIFGMGGYSSFPICLAASILKIKFIIYENNLIIGKANRYLLPFAKQIFVSYKELEGVPKKYENKVFEIGNIVREEIANSYLDKNQIKKFEKIEILVLGGSQGAKIFGKELPQVFKKIYDSELSIKIYQQCLLEQSDTLLSFYKDSGIDCEIFNFTDKIIDYYRKVNLVITRSGASVLGELVNVKVPFISIPLPTSADNHQYKNAEFYKKKGYGYLLEEKDINTKLYYLISSIFKEKTPLVNILSNQSQHSDKDIFKTLNKQIETILNEKN